MKLSSKYGRNSSTGGRASISKWVKYNVLCFLPCTFSQTLIQVRPLDSVMAQKMAYTHGCAFLGYKI